MECGIKRVMLASAAPSGRAKPPRMDRANHARTRLKQTLLNGDGVPDYPPGVQTALDACTAKQRQFALLVAAGASPSEAYAKSYDVAPDKDSRSLAVDARLTAVKPNVANAISAASQWLDTKWLLDAVQTVDWAVSNLYDIAEHAPKHSDRLKATELLLRKHGELVDRKVVTHIDGTEADTQEALLKSILADVELIPAIEAPPNQLLTEPVIRPTSCPHCGGAMADGPMMGDGDGI